MTITELKKYLKHKENKELIKEIVELFKKFSDVKDYYAGILSEDDGAVLNKYKKIIKDEFFPNRGFGKIRLSIAKKAISNYKKVSDSKVGVAEIMLYYVQMGSEFTNTYGDINESFYESMENMYESALIYIRDNNLVSHFKQECKEIVEQATEGWGFRDVLEDTFDSIF